MSLIAETLEQELRAMAEPKRLVVWLDPEKKYSRFVDRLVEMSQAGELDLPVVAFRGSFLEVMLALEPSATDTEPRALLLHVPGYNEASIRKTPLLEVYEQGVRFGKSLDTLVRQAASRKVAPDVLDAYLQSGVSSLEDAESWLSSQLSQAREGFEADLEKFGVAWVLRELIEGETGKAREGAESFFARETRAAAGIEALARYLHRHTGMDDAFRSFFGEDPAARPLSNLASAFFAWLLCVEYVQDLTRAPRLEGLRPLRDLGKPLVEVCSQLVRAIREGHPEAYERIADEVELRLKEELKEMSPDDLGQIDTFREEESRVLSGAVEAAVREQWDKVRAWSKARAGEVSFWLQRDVTRRLAWVVLAEAAAFDQALTRHPRPLSSARDASHAALLYQQKAYEVDRAHRRFEQKRLELLEPQLPHFGSLQEIVGSLRKRYRAWADALARDFSALCESKGYLPSAELQQRTLYEQVVVPLAAGTDKVAVFVVDALRYELCAELLDELKVSESAGEATLKARLAELPTLTSLGMNALAPVSRDGKLWVVGDFAALRSGEATVKTPGDRAKAMGLRSQGKEAVLLKLAEVCEKDARALGSKLKDTKVVVVHSREIDDAGEANVGLQTFGQTIGQLKAAFHHLQAAGIKQFVFTADHGFLLQDETTRSAPFGNLREPSRRHALSQEAWSSDDLASVHLPDLGYEGISGYLVLRKDTAVFATGAAGASFVHGGNSLQERVIPVLTVTRKRAEAASLTEYLVEARWLSDSSSSHRVKLRVLIAPSPQGTLGFAAAAKVTVALRVPHRSDVLVTLKDASVAGVLRGGRLEVPVGEGWLEAYFSLKGPQDEQVKVEVYHPDGVEKVTPAVPEGWFDVAGVGSASEAPPPPPPSISSWQEAFDDPGVRAVFVHLEKFDAISEAEATRMLGSPYAFRKFSRELDQHMRKVPFRVVSKPTTEGKRYEKVKDG